MIQRMLAIWSLVPLPFLIHHVKCRLDEVQAGIKSARRNINNLRYEKKKNTQQTKNRRNYLNIIDTFYEKLTTNTIPSWWKIENFSFKIRNERRMSPSSLLLNTVMEGIVQVPSGEKKIHTRKE